MKSFLGPFILLFAISINAKSVDEKLSLRVVVPMKVLQNNIDRNGQVISKDVLPMTNIDPSRIYISGDANVHYRGLGVEDIVGRIFQQTYYINFGTGGDPGPWRAGSLPRDTKWPISHKILEIDQNGITLEVDTSAIKYFQNITLTVAYLNRPVDNYSIPFAGLYTICRESFHFDESGKILEPDSRAEYRRQFPMICESIKNQIDNPDEMRPQDSEFYVH